MTKDLTKEQEKLQKFERRIVGLAAALGPLAAGAVAHAEKTGDNSALRDFEGLKEMTLALAEKSTALHAKYEALATQAGMVLQASGGDDKTPPTEAVLRVLGMS